MCFMGHYRFRYTVKIVSFTCNMNELMNSSRKHEKLISIEIVGLLIPVDYQKKLLLGLYRFSPIF